MRLSVDTRDHYRTDTLDVPLARHLDLERPSTALLDPTAANRSRRLPDPSRLPRWICSRVERLLAT